MKEGYCKGNNWRKNGRESAIYRKETEERGKMGQERSTFDRRKDEGKEVRVDVTEGKSITWKMTARKV